MSWASRNKGQDNLSKASVCLDLKIFAKLPKLMTFMADVMKQNSSEIGQKPTQSYKMILYSWFLGTNYFKECGIGGSKNNLSPIIVDTSVAKGKV